MSETKSIKSHASKSSRVSGSGSLRETAVRLAAKKASLDAEARLLTESEEVARQELITQQRRAKLNIKLEQAKVAAELEVYNANEDQELGDNDSEREPRNFDALLQACSIERKHVESWICDSSNIDQPEYASVIGNPALFHETQPLDDAKSTPLNAATSLHRSTASSSLPYGESCAQLRIQPASYEVSAPLSVFHYVPGCRIGSNNGQVNQLSSAFNLQPAGVLPSFTTYPAQQPVGGMRTSQMITSPLTSLLPLSQPNVCASLGQSYIPVNTRVSNLSVPVLSEDLSIHTLQQQQLALINSMQIPKLELMYFEGDPLQYYTFMKTFDSNVHSKNIPVDQKLGLLRQYCRGKAKQVIMSCELGSDEQGYETARLRLKQRFGDSNVISRAWLTKVTDFQSVKGNEGEKVRELADDLKNCYFTLQALNTVNEIDNQSAMQRIVCKLPVFLQNRWRKEATDVQRRTNSLPRFQALVDFVERAAEELTNPVYGEVSEPTVTSRKLQQNRDRDRRRSHAFWADSQANDGVAKESKAHKPCMCCHDDHPIFKCDKFKGWSQPERYKLVKAHGLCRLCLLEGHKAKVCDKTFRCKVPGCGKKHSTMLHTSEQDQPADTVPKTVLHSDSFATNSSSTTRLLPVLPVKVWTLDKKRCIEVYAMTDPCSTDSFCTTELLDELQITDRADKVLSMSTVSSEGSVVITQTSSLLISDLSSETFLGPILVCGKSSLHINLSSTYIGQDIDVNKWPHLEGISFPFIEAKRVSLLIGVGAPSAHWHLETRYGDSDEPYAYRSPLGWVICGPISTSSDDEPHGSFYTQSVLENQVERFWQLEDVSVYEHDCLAQTREEQLAIKTFDSSLRVVNGHYEMNIPLRNKSEALPDSRLVAVKRLQLLAKRMKKSEEFAKTYREEVDKMLQRGYAERLNDNVGRKWFLPHHGVINPNKPGKLRVVFDCAAKSDNVSLNDMVLGCPDLMNTLLGVLLRFRCGPVAVTGDIEAMYNQVRVTPEDRNMLCFLFWPGGDSCQEPVEYRMCVHLFGGSWSPCAANFALKKVAQDHSGSVSKIVIDTIKRNFYVDDCLRACDTATEAVQLVKELSDVLSTRGFHITKWASSSQEVLSTIPEADRGVEARSVKLADDTSLHERSLGVRWNVIGDTLGFAVTYKDRPDTRRGILSTVASVYDPLGLACPFIVPAKRLIQELTKQNLDWDSPVPHAAAEQWHRWKADLRQIESLVLPRNAVNGKVSDVISFELHHFCDASSYAYGVVSYLRAVLQNGGVHCSFVLAKSRLAPIKTVTIPRLELMAATMATNIDQLLHSELDINICSSTFWSDSQIVLHYIKASEGKRFKVFVANRLSTILSITSATQWFHVPSELNPADDVSRGLTASELLHSDRWIEGPKFLHSAEALSIMKTTPFIVTVSDDTEVISEASVYATIDSDSDIITEITSRFSSWFRLKMRIAWIQRAKQAFLSKIGKVTQRAEDFSCRDLRDAELFLLKRVQANSFPQIVDATCHDVKKYSRKTANVDERAIARLDPVLSDDGLLCVGGRLRHATNSSHPVILPSKHPITELIVRECHEKSGHAGSEHVLAALRTTFWIIRARCRIKEVVNKCLLCRKRRAVPCVQKMADLPRERISNGHPAFLHVGIDYFGPFDVHIRRSTEKRYGCVFSCMSSRAVHIEIATSLDTSSFINVLRRFIARRGKPAKVFTDNGTNFIGAERELSEAVASWNSIQTKSFLMQENIEWSFNPPHASHMGGVWERMIRSIRKILSGLLRSQRLTDELLSTLMCEVEAILNSRPLTYVSDCAEDLDVLTPNHLLLLRSGPTTPPDEFVKKDLYVRQRWRQSQYLADEFWRRWLREYLPQLQERQKWLAPQRDVQRGDLVLIVEPTPRCSWPTGRVVDVHRSDDGHVRSASVKTAHGVFERPIVKLCLLEGYDV